MRQDKFMRGREEYLASAITSAVGGARNLLHVGSSSSSGSALRVRGSMGASMARTQVCGWVYTSVCGCVPQCVGGWVCTSVCGWVGVYLSVWVGGVYLSVWVGEWGCKGEG